MASSRIQVGSGAVSLGFVDISPSSAVSRVSRYNQGYGYGTIAMFNPSSSWRRRFKMSLTRRQIIRKERSLLSDANDGSSVVCVSGCFANLNEHIPHSLCRRCRCSRKARRAVAAVSSLASQTETSEILSTSAEEYDAVVIGAGMGGLVTATQLAAKGAKVLLLEKYLIPGGSAGYFEREGYTFDVGSSMMFGFGEKGTTNLLTRALGAVNRKMDLLPDPTQVFYHLPNDVSVVVPRKFEDFIYNLTQKFPAEGEGIKNFYGECWNVFNALNSLDLKSLEEPRYLFGQFFRQPISCLTLAYYLPQNAGDIARKHIKDPELLSFIDMECFIVSTVNACNTPMINLGMVACDRHYGGINYPVGGVGKIAQTLAEGFEEKGGRVVYKANVKKICIENGRAVGVQTSDGRMFRGKAVISNATRWDTFEHLLDQKEMPVEEQEFQQRYKKSPSFLSIHLGADASVVPPNNNDVHHILLEDWALLEEPFGTIFVSIPTVLDKSLAPEGKHIFHVFTVSWIDDWKNLSPREYEEKKEAVADAIVGRLEALFPGLKKATTFREVGTPRTHRRFLGRVDGTYGPIPRRKPVGLLGMPFNTSAVEGLYCVGDSCFPGQGVNAVAFSGMACGHRVAADLGLEKTVPGVDEALGAFLKFLRSFG